MLRRRYEAYRTSGLSGLGPYTRGRGREMSDAEHLRVTSTATLDALEGFVPEYFAGHSYDAHQPWLACLRDGEATVVVLATDAITDEVDGFPQGVRHRVGLDRVRGAARPLREDIRRRAEAEPLR